VNCDVVALAASVAACRRLGLPRARRTEDPAGESSSGCGPVVLLTDAAVMRQTRGRRSVLAAGGLGHKPSGRAMPGHAHMLHQFWLYEKGNRAHRHGPCANCDVASSLWLRPCPHITGRPVATTSIRCVARNDIHSLRLSYFPRVDVSERLRTHCDFASLRAIIRLMAVR